MALPQDKITIGGAKKEPKKQAVFVLASFHMKYHTIDQHLLPQTSRQPH